MLLWSILRTQDVPHRVLALPKLFLVTLYDGCCNSLWGDGKCDWERSLSVYCFVRFCLKIESQEGLDCHFPQSSAPPKSHSCPCSLSLQPPSPLGKKFKQLRERFSQRLRALPWVWYGDSREIIILGKPIPDNHSSTASAKPSLETSRVSTKQGSFVFPPPLVHKSVQMASRPSPFKFITRVLRVTLVPDSPPAYFWLTEDHKMQAGMCSLHHDFHPFALC